VVSGSKYTFGSAAVLLWYTVQGLGPTAAGHGRPANNALAIGVKAIKLAAEAPATGMPATGTPAAKKKVT